jgi:hypothetical protein
LGADCRYGFIDRLPVTTGASELYQTAGDDCLLGSATGYRAQRLRGFAARIVAGSLRVVLGEKREN